MFCSKCGKEIQDGAAFCAGCGSPVGNGNGAPVGNGAPTQQNGSGVNINLQDIGKDKIFLGLIGLSLFLSSISMFLPVITAKLWGNSKSMNVFGLFDLNDLVEGFGKSTGFYSFLYVICILVSFAIVAATGKVVYDFLKGKKGNELMGMVNIASGLCIGRFVIAFIVMLMINGVTDEFGVKMLSVSVWEWIVTILAICAMTVFKKFYLDNLNKN